MVRNWMIGVAAVWWMSVPVVGWADVIEVAPGRSLEGVVIEETVSKIKVQVSWQGYVTFDRGGVVSIRRDSTGENVRLQDAWHQEALQKEQREQAQQAFEEAQRQHGYVKYRGEWITREELAMVQEEQLKKEREERANEFQQMTQQLKALQEDNHRLQQELVAAQQRYLNTPRIVVVEREPLCPLPLVRDEQGNVLPLQHHDAHQFVTTTDGHHLDVVASALVNCVAAGAMIGALYRQ